MLSMLTAKNNDGIQLWYKVLQSLDGLFANGAIHVTEVRCEPVLRFDAAVILLEHLQWL